jgi:HSP20 family protein
MTIWPYFNSGMRIEKPREILKLKKMTLVKFNKPASRLGVSGFNSLLNDFFINTDFPQVRPFGTGTRLPAVNVSEIDQEFHLELTVPGFSKDEINLAIEDDSLIIRGEKKTEAEQTEKIYSRKEFSYQNFKRTFNLPENVDQEKIGARFENGILFIGLPKKEAEAKASRKIELQ